MALADLSAAAARAEGASADALNQLHGVLTGVQRGALVDKVEAHWVVWQAANDNGPATLGPDLDLTVDQMNRIHAALGNDAGGLPAFDPQEVTAHLRAFGDAFRSERFDARASALASAASTPMIDWGAGRMARFVEAVSPILTADQRASFALTLREHARHDPNVAVSQ